jgi:polyisoprenoid-binding protein YceI
MSSTTFRPLFVAAILAALGPGARAQTRWTIDAKSSLAWWQVNPHLNHLWATTCPEEPSWRPGEGRSAGWVIGQALRPPKHGYAGVNDTTIVPLYPRYEALPVCTEAVQGQVLVADTVRWRGVRGEVRVRGDELVTGEERRDTYSRQAVLETTRYPEIRFTIDSLVGVTRHADTVRGTAVGVLTLRDVSKPMTAGVQAWPEAGGVRVVAKLRIPATELTEEWGLSKFALGLGVTTRIWYDLFMGVDVVLRR